MMALLWEKLTSIAQVDDIIEQSARVPCLIMKHSTRCSISSLALHRLEDDWDFAPEKIKAWYLDLLAHRDVSAHLSKHFDVHHESPQILLIRDGECFFDASHLDISVEEIKEQL
jgi:bacillithiol system protein YtxJ